MHVTFEHSEPTAPNILTFFFKPDKPVNYLAGQFTEIKLPHDNVDDRGDKRWFTLSSSPTDALLSITTKFAEKPSSFKQTLRQLKPGAKLNVAEPMGDFVLPKDDTIPLLFVAGGIGITPFHSIVKYLNDTQEKRDISLLYSVSKPEEIVFDDLFHEYPLKLTYTTQSASPNWTGEVGRLTAERIIAAAQDKKRRIYISGPEPMVEDLIDSLSKKEIPDDQLVGDYFPGYPIP